MYMIRIRRCEPLADDEWVEVKRLSDHEKQIYERS